MLPPYLLYAKQSVIGSVRRQLRNFYLQAKAFQQAQISLPGKIDNLLAYIKGAFDAVIEATALMNGFYFPGGSWIADQQLYQLLLLLVHAKTVVCCDGSLC